MRERRNVSSHINLEMVYTTNCDPSGIQVSPNAADAKANRKRVSFASLITVSHVESWKDFALDERHNLWWSSELLEETYHEALGFGREAFQKPWMVKGFEEAFESAQQVASASFLDNESMHQSLISMEASRDILHWCRYGHSWRGLERSSSTNNNAARSAVQRNAAKAILDDYDSDPEATRLAYERESLPAKMFARVMGEGDALAVSQGMERVLLKNRRLSGKEDGIVPLTSLSCSSLQSLASEASINSTGNGSEKRQISVSSKFHAVCA